MPFISFSHLTALTRTFQFYTEDRNKSGQPCLVPDLRGKVFNLSPLNMMLTVGLSYVFMLRYVPSIHNLLSIFSWKDVTFCQILFYPTSIESIISFLCFILLTYFITFIDMPMLNHPCIPGVNSRWSCHLTSLIFYWIDLLILCWECLHLYPSGILFFSFFVCSVHIWFGIRTAFVKWVCEYSLLFNFLEGSEKNW